MLVPPSKVGSEYIKLKTGKRVKWQTFDEKTQMFEIELPSGEIAKVHRGDIVKYPNEYQKRTSTSIASLCRLSFRMHFDANQPAINQTWHGISRESVPNKRSVI